VLLLGMDDGTVKANRGLPRHRLALCSSVPKAALELTMTSLGSAGTKLASSRPSAR